MFIVYQSDDEVIVTTPENEPETVRQYFTEGGRSLDEYDRECVQEVAVAVRASLKVG